MRIANFESSAFEFWLESLMAGKILHQETFLFSSEYIAHRHKFTSEHLSQNDIEINKRICKHMPKS
jgi:hypothetical protein